jgi:heme/copper-type cytochrome/quinol oxidase subunit 2
MALNNYEEDPFDRESFQEEIPPEPEKKPGNRTFLTVIIVLGGIFLLALVALLIFAPKYLASQRTDQMEQAALINAANTATAMAAINQANQLQTQLAQTAEALVPTTAPTNTPVVAVATNTPVVSGTGLSAAEMATVSALQTQMAGQGTLVATPTELPDTGFADEYGLPLMAGLTVILVVIIIFSRKLRLSSR